MLQNLRMAKKKTDPPASGDRHKPSRMVRIRQGLADQLDTLVEQMETDFTELVNVAVREYLERHGVRKPPGKPTA